MERGNLQNLDENRDRNAAGENHARFRSAQAVKHHLSYESHITSEFSENVRRWRGGVQFVAAFMVAGRRGE